MLRSVRVRARLAAVALLALTLQMLAIGLHGGQMAAGRAEAARVAVELADLGLTLADLPCHSGLAAKGGLPASLPADVDQAAKSCPICKLHNPVATLAAVEADPYALGRPAVRLTWPDIQVAGADRHFTTRARAPPTKA